MRRTAVLLLCLLPLWSAAGAAPADTDLWPGRYRLDWVAGSAAAKDGPADMVLARAPDADPAKLPAREEGNVGRWTLSAPANPKDGAELKRFAARDYEGWGWSALHAAGQLDCLDAGHLFVCRTAPGTTMTFGPEGPKQERLEVRTGVFGIALHAGAFELTKTGIEK